MVKIMAMVDGQLKEIDSQEMFDELMRKQSLERRQETKKAINKAYGDMVNKDRKDEPKEEKTSNDMDEMIKAIKSGNSESILNILKQAAENCNCPKCQERRAKEKAESIKKSMNQEEEMLNDILSALQEAIVKTFNEIVEEEEELHNNRESSYKRISDLEYEISNLVDDLKTMINKYNDLDIRGIVYGINKQEFSRHQTLEKEIKDTKVKLTELVIEKRKLIKSLEK